MTELRHVIVHNDIQFILSKNSFKIEMGEKGLILSKGKCSGDNFRNGKNAVLLEPLYDVCESYLTSTCDLVQDGSAPFICLSTVTTSKSVSEAIGVAWANFEFHWSIVMPIICFIAGRMSSSEQFGGEDEGFEMKGNSGAV